MAMLQKSYFCCFRRWATVKSVSLSMQAKRAPPAAPVGESKIELNDQKVDSKQHDPRLVVMAMLNKQSNPSSARDPRSKAVENDEEKRKGLIQRQLTSAASEDGPLNEAIEKEERNPLSQNSMQRDGLDPSITDLDPEKSVSLANSTMEKMMALL
ncbi:hypothetical protein ACHAW5_007620 [Stephanodiscus triporus]|uniref:Uncharacterized protein n=1 Tax=Stephanodiscus triporus TaxID=2934178 RepID=A0ABD3N0Y1_9STRA